MDAFSGRELAGMWWAVVTLAGMAVLAVRQPAVRHSIAQVVIVGASPKILAPVVAIAIWIAAAITLALKFGLWTMGLVVPTVVWFLCGALPLMFRAMTTLDRERSMRSLAAEGIGVSALLAAVIDIQSFDAWAEALLFQPVLLIAVLMVGLGRGRASRGAEVFLGAVGVMLLLLALTGLPFGEPASAWADVARAITLGAWLTVVLLPLLFILRTGAALEVVLMRVTWGQQVMLDRWKISVAILTSVGPSADRLTAVSVIGGAHQIAAARDIRSARRAVQTVMARAGG